ncbi:MULTISPECIES: TetR/AcrR family transcriptional regulator [unclassified Cupriavidus]|uniref:TetR/AcrR family transcriptional regulator n=1 Tax=unclassified Cupriavidus TaxID=2640874 RepID=UPI0003BE3FE4|nr:MULTISPECIES: TetR/AcrR family transcriptional regulator [unclassified Cupriavidus]ESJ22635.1 TetR family transcriptional regulator [Cupriavidus sp. HPC(L)]MCD9124089.1 TetR/AcrR family transcriptional regulator [Cupriavidus sp. UGS-1]
MVTALKLAVAPPPRTTYRHGDLRRALIDAGIALASDGGPDAVVLREATRRAGVVPNAAYRHFANRQALFEAVRAAALSALAVAMETELAAAAEQVDRNDPAARARADLRAIGAGYLKFAQTQTGLFRTAFATPSMVEDDPDPAKAGPGGLNPFQLLGAALDRLVAAGVLPAERRPGAEYLAWSAVHGLALLIIDGPLRHADEAMRIALGERVLAMVEKGL